MGPVFTTEDKHSDAPPRESRSNARPIRAVERMRSRGGTGQDRAEMLYYKKSHEPSDSWAFPRPWRILARVRPGGSCVLHRFSGAAMRLARFSPALLAGYVIAVFCRGDEPAESRRNSSSCAGAAVPVPRRRIVLRHGLPRQRQGL